MGNKAVVSGDSVIKVTVPVKISEQDIEDLMVTAIEGGIGYFACLDNRSEIYVLAPKDEPVAVTAASILNKGGGVTFLDTEDNSVEWVLTKEKLLRGVQKFLEEDVNIVLYIDNGELDMCMIDADHADRIVQYALFGDLVYG